jgi:L-ascorbate metabolism protein UlaG (beta-lactamase superfamily)
MGPGDTGEFDAIKVWARPAYNLNKTFHKKGDGQVGYVIEINGVRIYHAGDTDNIPELADLKNIDLALLPVSGVYVMDWQEAVEAVKIIKPKIVIPMHYGNVVGSEDDARKFKEKAECRVEII